MSFIELMDLSEKQRMNLSIAYNAYSSAHKEYKAAYNKTKTNSWSDLDKKQRIKLTKEVDKAVKKYTKAKKKYFELCKSYNVKPTTVNKTYY